MQLDKINQLLEKVGILNYKYSLLKEETQFNIFKILRNVHDEVYLHSQFIYELLSPHKNHPYTNLFAKSFLEIIDATHFEIEVYNVKKEYKNIDILLTNKTQAIIIENKMLAGDQDKQLERYYETITKEGYSDVLIYYLTPHGTSPSEQSLGKLDEKIVQNISYKYEIHDWLENCINIASRNPQIRETIIQYQNLIKEITGNSQNMEERHEIIKLLSENDNIEKAFLIANNWVHVKWHTEWDFWIELEKKVLENGSYDTKNTHRFSAQKINNVIHHSRNRKPWYGLKWKIAIFKNTDIFLAIERGSGNMYYGIAVYTPEIRDEVKMLITEFCEAGNNGSCWAGWKHFEPYISLENFSDKNTLMLRNEQHRKEVINNCWLEIENLINNTLKAIN